MGALRARHKRGSESAATASDGEEKRGNQTEEEARQEAPGLQGVVVVRVELNSDVQKLAAFMQTSFETAKLVALADGIADIAPILWGHYAASDVAPILSIGDQPECKPETSKQSA